MIFLYGYLTIDNWRENSTQFQGGIYANLKFVLDISLGVQVGKGALGTSKTIYGLEVPIFDLGSRYQIRGFATEDPAADTFFTDSLEVYREVKNYWGSFDVTKEDREIYAMDMMTGDVIPYYPEADEFTYEIIEWQQKPATPAEEPLPIGKTAGMQMYGRKQKEKSWATLHGQADFDPDLVQTYEVIYLDELANESLAKFTVTVKLTYNPPLGVMVKGSQFTKIIHYTVDQSSRGKYIAYANDFYNQEGNTKYLGTNFDIYTYMTNVEVEPESQPENNIPHVTGYTFKGWNTYVGNSAAGYGEQYWYEADEDAVKAAYGEKDGHKTLKQNLKYEIVAEPNRQKLHVRHYVINAEGTDYELLGEDENWTRDWVVSDAEYGLRDFIYSDGYQALDASENMNIPDMSCIENYFANGWLRDAHVVVTYENGEQVKLTTNSKVYVTPTDSKTAVDSIDVYFEKRADYAIRCVGVDENGKEINGISEAVKESYITVGAKAALPSKQFLEKGMTGFSFDGWYDTKEYDALKDKSGNCIMPDHDITVYYKMRSVPMELTVIFECERDGGFIGQCYYSTMGGKKYTPSQLLNEKWIGTKYVPSDVIGTLIPSDREAVADGLDKAYIMGGFPSLGYGNDTVVIKLTEPQNRPENLNIRLVYMESDKVHLEEGTDKKYWEITIPADDSRNGCAGFIELPAFLQAENIEVPAGCHFDRFYSEINGENSWIYGESVPVFKNAHLTDGEWSSYDSATNTLTYIFRVNLWQSSQSYQVRYWCIQKDGTKKLYKTVKKSGFAHDVMNTDDTVGMTVIGYEKADDLNPETFTISGEEETVIDYYLRAASYPFNFIVKDQLTGEVLYEYGTKNVSAYDTIAIPTECTMQGGGSAIDQEGFKLIGWQNENYNYYSTSARTITSREETQGVYEAVFAKKDAKVTLHWKNNGSFVLGDTNYSTRFGEDEMYGVRTVKTYTGFELPVPSMKKGAAFIGWYDNPEFTGEPVKGEVKVSKATDFYAYVIEQFEIVFDGNGNEKDPCIYQKKVAQTYNSLLKEPADDPERSNYDFMGWSTEKDGEALPYGTRVTEAKTLYAVWSPKLYGVSFDVDGGTWSEKKVKYHTYGESTTAAPTEVPVKEGYNFLGWMLTGTTETVSAQTISFGPYDLSTDRYYTAVWEPKEYTITYNANGGTMPASVTSVWTVKTPVRVADIVPEKAEAVFVGWYDDKDCTDGHLVKKLDYNRKAGDVELFARWEENSYPVFVNLKDTQGKDISIENYSDTVPSGYHASDEALTLTTPASAEKWQFVRWELVENNEAKTVTTLDFKDRKGMITLNAVFSLITHSITYDLNGGTLKEGSFTEAASANDIVRIPRPAREGYVFNGWKLNGNTTVGDSFTMGEKDAKLKAQWINEAGQSGEAEKNYTVKLYLNGELSDTLSKKACGGEFYVSVLAGAFSVDTKRYSFSYASCEGNKGTYGYYDNAPLKEGAVYSVYYETRKYDVEYMDGSKLLSKDTLAYSDVIKAPKETPKKEGYSFNGWDFDFTLGKTAGECADEFGRVRIYAKDWTLENFTITYTG